MKLIRALLMLMAALSQLALFAPGRCDAGEKNTSQILRKFGEDIAAAWTEFPSDKQESIRAKKIEFVKQEFDTALTKASAPDGMTVSDAIENLGTSLNRGPAIFKSPKMKQKPDNYNNACVRVFARELLGSKESKEVMAYQDIYEKSLDWFTATREVVKKWPPTIADSTYEPVHRLTADLIQKGKKDSGDPFELLEKNIKEARRRFPINAPVLKVTNQPILNVCEMLARMIQTKNTSK